MNPSSPRIDNERHNIDHAVALEREAIAAWLDNADMHCHNCDGRLCMGCAFREHHHHCAHDCPDCCNNGQQIPHGKRLAASIRAGEHHRAATEGDDE